MFEKDDIMDQLQSKYDLLRSSYSVRANNVLDALQQNYANKQKFLYSFVRMTRDEFAKLKNCGRKTVNEIQELQDSLVTTRIIFNDDDPEFTPPDKPSEPVFFPKKLPTNIDSLLPLIMPRLAGLSARAKNGFLIFLEDNHNSLTNVYAVITNPKFVPVRMKNVGRKTSEEIMSFLDGIKEYMESFSDEQSVEDVVTNYNTKTLDDLQIPYEAQVKIHELENTLGHFPLFAALKAYFEGLEGEDRAIIDGLFLIHEGQTLRERDEVAAELGLGSERIRQKCRKTVEAITEYITTYHSYGFVDKCPYRFQMRRVNEDINLEEGTDFNLNFIYWVLATVFEEVTLLGDVVKTITGYFGKKHFLCLVPTYLCQYMDFSAFLEDIDARLVVKRINEEKVNLQNLINSHLKTRYCEDEMPALETACRSILYLHYPVEVDFGQVIFKPNARKNNPIVIEEIIRAAGHPLTMEEIYEEFIYQYPERYTEMNALRGSINNNPNIVPISRTSTYTLSEWNEYDYRGGSIRGIIAEYLNSLEPTIAPITDIVEYVTRFRPATDEKNITSNLMLDKSGMFDTYYKDGVRCIALAGQSYPMDYFLVETEARSASAQSKWYPRLVRFIEETGHFPFSVNVGEEEIQLCHFWIKQERYYRNGELTQQGLHYHEMILQQFGHLKMDKKEYDWRLKYDLLWRNCFGGDGLGQETEISIDLEGFTESLFHDYVYRLEKIPRWKKDAIVKFMDHFKGQL